jgi:hypothetical protein
MKRYRFLTLICAAVLGTAALSFAQKMSQHDIDVQPAQASAQTTGQHDHAMMQVKTGKTGTLTLTEPTVIGDITLAPGDYEVRHISNRTGHFIEFTRFGWEQVLLEGGDLGPTYQPQFVREVVARESCDVEPLNAKVEQTELMANAADRKLALEIRGENVKHIF